MSPVYWRICCVAMFALVVAVGTSKPASFMPRSAVPNGVPGAHIDETLADRRP